MIRDTILYFFRIYGMQADKKELIEYVSGKCGCTQKEAAAEYAAMKKEGLVYSVRGMPGWVGLYETAM